MRSKAVLKARFIDKSYKFGVFVALFVITADNYLFRIIAFRILR